MSLGGGAEGRGEEGCGRAGCGQRAEGVCIALGISLAGLFRGYCDFLFHLLNLHAVYNTPICPVSGGEMCHTSRSRQASHGGERETVESLNPLRTEREAATCAGLGSPGRNISGTEIQGPEQPLSITQDTPRKLMFT